MTNWSAAVRAELAKRTGTNPEDWYLTFKARYAMQVVFDAIAAEHGPGDVATQIFTCATAIDPILVAGLTPRYCEISPETIAIPSWVVEPRRNHPALESDPHIAEPSLRAIVIQHTFGIIADEDEFRRLSAPQGCIETTKRPILIEDSAHCVARMARANGRPIADISIHSFGVEKMLPTRFGGAVWISPDLDPALRARIVERLEALPPVSGRLASAVRWYRHLNGVLNRLPASVAKPARAALVRAGALEPAITPVELRGGLAYPPLAPSDWIAEQMAAGLRKLPEIEKQRVEAVAVYVEQLRDVVEIPAAITENDPQPLLRFPFFAKDNETAEAIIAALIAAGVNAGRWYRPAFFPGASNDADYHYESGSLPVTEDLIARVVNLPTNVSPEEANRIAAIVRTGAAK